MHPLLEKHYPTLAWAGSGCASSAACSLASPSWDSEVWGILPPDPFSSSITLSGVVLRANPNPHDRWLYKNCKAKTSPLGYFLKLAKLSKWIN